MKKRLLTLCVLLLSGTLFTACSDTKPPGSDAATCRNNKLDAGEICDDTVPGKECPANQSACDELFRTDKTKSSCLKELKFSGDPTTCSSTCEEVFYPEAECNRTTGKTCGNRTVDTDAGEKCDSGIKSGPGRCPTSANCSLEKKSACHQAHKLAGKALDCTAECVPGDEITQPKDGDGCCPAGADKTTDNDCFDPVDMGGACSKDAECQAGNGGESAFCQFYNGVKGDYTQKDGAKGMCTRECDIPSNPCGDDTKFACVLNVTTNKQVCVSLGCDLNQSDSCGVDGYQCLPYNRAATVGVCLPYYYAGTDKIGDPCTEATATADCGSDGICKPQGIGDTFPGGICVADCSDLNDFCPNGTKCGLFSENVKRCQKECETDDNCRPGYFCTEFGVCYSRELACTNDPSLCPATSGYQCLDSPGETGVKRCEQVGSSDAPVVGKVCNNVTNCGGGENALCLIVGSSPTNPDDAYKVCDLKCENDTDCDAIGSGFACAERTNPVGRKYKICQKPCDLTDDAPCKAMNPYFYCNKESATAQPYCSFARSARSYHYGKSCTDDATCQADGGADAFCLKNTDGTRGFCSTDCGGQDNIECGSTDLGCFTFEAGGPHASRCLPRGCRSNADCAAKIPGTVCRITSGPNPVTLCVYP